MLKAPATANRIAYYKQANGIEKLTLVDYMNRASNVIIEFFGKNSAYIVVTLVCFVVALLIVIHQNKSKTERIYDLKIHGEAFMLLLLSSVSCGALIMSPYIETRSFLFSDFFMLVCIVYYSDFILKQLRHREVIQFGVSTVLIVSTFFCAIHIYQIYCCYHDFCVKRESAVWLSEAPVFYWGEYPGERFDRILTTREDYLMGNERRLEEYYSKDIDILNGSIWSVEVSGYKAVEAIGHMDEVFYEKDTQTVKVSGWGAFQDHNKQGNELYVIARSDVGKYYFSTSRCQRSDVAAALTNEDYLDTGFYSCFTLMGEMTGGDTLDLGLCIVNREDKLVNELYFKSIQLH